jgi:RNA polymerase sigma factor (sigma-70 family)
MPRLGLRQRWMMQLGGFDGSGDRHDPSRANARGPGADSRLAVGRDLSQKRIGMPTEAETEASEGRPAAEIVTALVGNHRQFLAFLERRVGSRAIAEDILQDAFVRGIDRLDTLRSDEAAVAWFYRLLRNAVVDHQRRRGASERKLEAFRHEVEQQPEPGAELRGAICRCVTDLAGTLKPEYADALHAVEVDGVAVKDFAERAGISASNAGVRIFRAREALRKQVIRSCGTCADHGCLNCTCARSAGGCGSGSPSSAG